MDENEDLTIVDSKPDLEGLARYAEHLRTVHFTLTIACISIVALLLAAKEPKIDAAIADVEAIQRLDVTLEDGKWISLASKPDLKEELRSKKSIFQLWSERRALSSIGTKVSSDVGGPSGCYFLLPSYKIDEASEGVPWFFDWDLAERRQVDLGYWRLQWRAFHDSLILDFDLQKHSVQYADLPRDASLRTTFSGDDIFPGGIARYVSRAGGIWKDVKPTEECSSGPVQFRGIKMELARLDEHDPALAQGYTHGFYPDLFLPGVVPAVRLLVKARTIDTSLQDYLSSKAWVGTGKKWQGGDFKEAFPELNAITEGLDSLDLKEATVFLKNLRESLSPQERIEVAGLKLPAEVVKIGGHFLYFQFRFIFCFICRHFPMKHKKRKH